MPAAEYLLHARTWALGIPRVIRPGPTPEELIARLTSLFPPYPAATFDLNQARGRQEDEAAKNLAEGDGLGPGGDSRGFPGRQIGILKRGRAPQSREHTLDRRAGVALLQETTAVLSFLS